MADNVKRLHYFNGQFLREPDFTLEQNYHIAHQRDHARLLHKPGVAEGLTIPTPAAGATAVTINAGVAYDDQGRRIVLADNLILDLADQPDGDVYVTIAYREQQGDAISETGTTGNTRWTETPLIETSAGLPSDPNTNLVLAKVIRSGTTITSIETTDRRIAGVRGGDLAVRRLQFTSESIAPAGWVEAQLGAGGRADLAGSLRIAGDLTVTGSISGDLTNNAVASSKLAEADGTTGQDTNTGSGVKTGHLQDGAVTLAKLAPAVRPIVSIDGVGNPGGDVDLFPSGAITITPDDANNRITIGETHSARTDNPHATTAAQVNALALTGGVLTGNVVLNVAAGDEPDNQTYGVVVNANTGSSTIQTVAFNGQASGSGSGSVIGLNVAASGSGSGWKQGLSATVSGAGFKHAGQFNAYTTSATSPDATLALSAYANSAGSGSVQGLSLTASGDGAGQKTGILCSVSGGGGKFAGQFNASTENETSGDWTQGLAVSANSAGSGGSIGLGISAYGEGSGEKTGLSCTASGLGRKQAGQFSAFTTSADSEDYTQALYAYAYSAGSGGVVGLSAGAYGDGAGQKTGISCNVSGGGHKFAGQFSAATSDSAADSYTQALSASASSAGSGGATGFSCQVSGDGGGAKNGIQSYASGEGWKAAGTFHASTNSTTNSAEHSGVRAFAVNAGTGTSYGIYASASGAGTGAKYGIYSTVSGGGTTRYAGYFNGNVHVAGTLSKTSGSFLIDHPLDPHAKTLRHSFVESPEELCLYRGRLLLDRNGKGTVDLPEYFAELTSEEEATVTLTAIGRKPFVTSYEWNRAHTAFTVFGEAGGEVSYLVLAARDDPAIRLLRRPVEEEKPEAEQGTLIFPDAYGEAAETAAFAPAGGPPETAELVSAVAALRPDAGDEVPGGRPPLVEPTEIAQQVQAEFELGRAAVQREQERIRQEAAAQQEMLQQMRDRHEQVQARLRGKEAAAASDGAGGE